MEKILSAVRKLFQRSVNQEAQVRDTEGLQISGAHYNEPGFNCKLNKHWTLEA